MESIFVNRFKSIEKSEEYTIYTLKNNIFYIRLKNKTDINELLKNRKYKEIEKGKDFFIGLYIK